jgi:outer membrane protein assembly factor BamB
MMGNRCANKRRSTRQRAVAACTLLVLTLLAACSGPAKPKPGPLETIAESGAATSLRLVWSQRFEAVRFPLALATHANHLTLAGDDGTVVSLDATSGKELARGSVAAKLSGGVGSDGRWSAVATRDGRVVVLEEGRILWSQTLGSRVVTRPMVAGERVFVLATDRSVHAFDAGTGAKLWTVRRPGDALTLSQSGVLLAVGNTLVVGQGSRLAGIDPANGNVTWELPLATPRGTNEIERLADLVGPVGRAGDVVCARAFQSAVSCVNTLRGTLLWTRNLGGTQGITMDAQTVVAADASSRVTAWRAATGEVLWSTDALLHRDLSHPVVLPSGVAFGDANGMVHVLARDSGKTTARLPTDGSPIQTLALAADATLVAVTRNGGVFAFRL